MKTGTPIENPQAQFLSGKGYSSSTDGDGPEECLSNFLTMYKLKLTDTTWNLGVKEIQDKDCPLISKLLLRNKNLEHLT